MAEVLYRWPAAAEFGRTVPKTRFYEHAKVRAQLREKFVNDVQRIVWAFKLADATIRLQGSSAVPEIQVFIIETKGANVSDDVLGAIDRSVQFPVVFEIVSADRVRMVAAHKTLGATSPKIGSYLTTGWQPADAPRLPLPTAIDLPNLYEAVLASLLPTKPRPGETVSEATDRMGQVSKLRREIVALERKLRTEPQLNRKIELRRQIMKRTAVLTELTDPVPSKKE